MQVIDLGLEVLDFLVKLEDGLPNVLGIQLVVVNSAIIVWLASSPRSTIPWHLKTSCSMASSFVSTLPVCLGPSTSRMCTPPLTHLNGWRVMQHLREIGVDNPLEKLVLGGTWRRHDDLDLSEKQLETKTRDICVIRESKPPGDYIMIFY